MWSTLHRTTPTGAWLVMQIPMQKHPVNLPEDYADTCSQPGRGLRWQRYQLGKHFAEGPKQVTFK